MLWCAASIACGSEKATEVSAGEPAPGEVPVAVEPGPAIVEPPAPGPAPATDEREAIAAREAAARRASKHRLESAQLEAEAERMLAALVSANLDDTLAGGFRNDMDQRGDLEAEIAKAEESGVAIRAGGAGTRGSAKGPAVGTSLGPKIDTPSARVVIATASLSEPSALSAGEVTAKIKRQYIPGLKRCHERRLRLEPTATATVRLSFTIHDRGITRGMSTVITPPDDTLGACLRSVVGSWRFSIPRDAAGDPTDVEVTIELTLSPR